MSTTMRYVLLSDVLEISMLNLPDDRTSIVLTTGDVLERLKKTNPCAYKRVAPGEVRTALQDIFSIHKNPREKNRAFKIRRKEAQNFIEGHAITLRPLEHARISPRMRVSYEAV